MRLVISTWRGFNINDGVNYVADFPEGMPLVTPSTPVAVELLDAPAKVVGRKLASPTLSILVQPQSDYRTKREVLRDLFRTEEEFQFYPLVALDADNGDVAWTIQAAVLTVSPKDDAFVVVLAPQDPYWTATAVNATQAYTASEQSKAFTVSTPSPHKVHPKLTITPTAQKGVGFFQQRWMPIKDPGVSVGPRPFDVGNASLDTAAFVLAGKMLASGYDCRISIDGYEVPRWMSNFNSANTKVWVNLTLKGIKPLPLSVGISNVGVPATISFTNNAANEAVFKNWPTSGEVVIGSEGFQYTGKTSDALNLVLTGITRAIKGTVAATHVIGDYGYYQTHDIRLLYNNSTATDPAYSDDTKPIIDLDQSTNTQHVFLRFGTTKGTPGPLWLPSVSKSNASGVDESKPYGNIHAMWSALYPDPYQVAGVKVTAYYLWGVWYPTTVLMSWLYSSPLRIKRVQLSGEKYASWITGQWPNVRILSGTSADALLERLEIVIPNPLQVWGGWSYDSGDITASPVTMVKLELNGTSNNQKKQPAAVELNSAVLDYFSADIPAIVLAPEKTSYDHNLLIENLTTGSKLRIIKTVQLNQAIVIDTQTHSVTVNGADSSAGVYPDNVSVWFEMVSGVNNIKLTDTGLLGVSLTVEGSGERRV